MVTQSSSDLRMVYLSTIIEKEYHLWSNKNIAKQDITTIPIFKPLILVTMEGLLYLSVKIDTKYRTIYVIAKSKYLGNCAIVSVDPRKTHVLQLIFTTSQRRTKQSNSLNHQCR